MATMATTAPTFDKGARLRALLFGAEEADKRGDLPEAQSLWLQLLQFLQADALDDVTTAAHTGRLGRLATARLHAIAVHQATSTGGAGAAPLGAAAASDTAAAADLAGRLSLRSAPYAALFAAAAAAEGGGGGGGGAGRLGAPAHCPGFPSTLSSSGGGLPAPAPASAWAAGNDPPHARKRAFPGGDGGGGDGSDAWRGGGGGGCGPASTTARPPLGPAATNDAAVPASAPAFTSARAKLQMDALTKAGGGRGDGRGGGHGSGSGPASARRPGFDPGAYSSGDMFPGGAGAFRPGRGGGGGGPPGAAATRPGFVPPLVAKALAGPPGGGKAGGGGGGAGGAANPPSSDGPLSERTLRLLARPDGTLPDPLDRLDPATLETICNEVMDGGAAPVAWADIAGQEAAKALVQELVVWPMLNPHLFTGARSPPRGLLLFGPPGTGKTLLGRAVASNVKATFFSISASSLTSKWIGEGEKLVRALFAVAAALAPSVVFIDEIDSILSARRGDGGEHEASRRLKTEMLVQMEGCASGGVRAADGGAPGAGVLVVGATNRPEELDEAARRRLPKQLYVPLPCGTARRAMLDRALKATATSDEQAGGGGGGGGGVAHALSEADVAVLVAKTAGYSGSDMRALIQEACQGPVRDALRRPPAVGGAAGPDGAAPPPPPALAGLTPADLRPVTLRDFKAAARVQRPSVAPEEVARYEAYDAKHGAKYVEGGGGCGKGGEEEGGEMDWA